MRALVMLVVLSTAGCTCGPTVAKVKPSLNVSPAGFDFGKVKGRDFGTAAFRCVQPGSAPICSRHEVVAQQSNTQIGHLTNQ